MSAPPSPRVLRRALDVVQGLPPAALALLVERLISRLDAGEADADLEDDDPAECGGDPEPDDADHGAMEDEPLFPRPGWPLC